MRAFKEVAYEAARRPLVFSRLMLVSEARPVPRSWNCGHTGVPNGITYVSCGKWFGVVVTLACAHCKEQISSVGIAPNGMRSNGTVFGSYRCSHGQKQQLHTFGKTLLLCIDACGLCKVEVGGANLG